MPPTLFTAAELIAALGPERRSVKVLYTDFGVSRASFETMVAAYRDELAAAGAVLHTATVSQAQRSSLYIEVDGRRVASLSRPAVLVEDAPAAPALLAVRPPAPLAPIGTLSEAAAAADSAAARGTLARYRAGLAAETRRAQDADLARWGAYLVAVEVAGAGCDWGTDASCWAAVSWGLVEGFVVWQEREGYARASIARALSTVRCYAKQASRAGALPVDALRLIETVQAPARGKAARNRDAQRTITRIGDKKAEATKISPAQARALKQQPTDTPVGRRDGLIMCLLLEHGLRVSELADLNVTDLDTARGQLTFYRRKVNLSQTHTLSPATLRAAKRYLAEDAPAAGRLLRAVERRAATTLGGPIAAQGIRELVTRLGLAAGVAGLSPHDCRHFWATAAAEAGVDPLRLQEAGGWASLGMPRHYVARAAIANAGMPMPMPDDEDEV
jgi:integrase